MDNINTSLHDSSCVYYSDFGACGDGVTNDYEAIKAAHEFANKSGKTVMADGTKTYLLTDVPEPIVIKTNVDFCGAKLIFDDTRVTGKNNPDFDRLKAHGGDPIFKIMNDYPYLRADEDMLKEVNSQKDEEGYILRGMEIGGQSNRINLKLGYPAFLLIKNGKNYTYKRYGFIGGNKGTPQREILLIDAEGNIDPSTPMLHGFRDITEIVIQRQDVAPITIKNASVETRASRINHTVNYYVNRNFAIERPHVTFDGIKHSIVGEIPRFAPVRCDKDGLSYIAEGYTNKYQVIYDKDGNVYTGDDVKPFLGLAYNGFVHADVTNDTLFKNCAFCSHVLYIEGTYDISGQSSNKLVFEDCVQSNFFIKDENGNDTSMPNMFLYWGVAGTNYCKNMDYIRCKLTRYDAHAGVTNGKIIDSEIAVLRLIGGGDFRVENTKIHAYYNFPIQLREDYGASFNGTLTVKDCTVIDARGTGETVSSLMLAPNSYWDMGYKTFFPNIIIDNLKFDKTVYPDIALIYNSQPSEPDYHAPTVNIFKDGRQDPNTPSDFYYSTYEPDAWIEENIKAEGAEFFGLSYDIYKNWRGSMTVVVHDTKNRFPYTPPKFIRVFNNEDNGYQLTLYDSPFFENTMIEAGGNNLKIVEIK